MPLIRQSNSETFISILSGINEDIRMHGKENMLNINIVAETFFCILLNYLYDLNLKNANQLKKNFPGIDLIDEIHKIVFQVTSNYTSTKINDTLSMSIIGKLKNEGYQIKFCFIGSQNFKHKKLAIHNPFEIKYEPKNDDILMSDLVTKFIGIEDVNKQEIILDFLLRESGKNLILHHK